MIALALAQNCFDPTIQVEEYIKTPQPYEYLKNEELPTNYDPYGYLMQIHQIVVTSMASHMYLSPKISISLSIVDPVGLSLLHPLFPIVFVL